MAAETPPNLASVAYLGGYVVSGPGTRVFGWSTLADPADMERTGLNKRKSPRPDYPADRIKDALYVFKATGFERWAVTGLAGRMPGRMAALGRTGACGLWPDLIVNVPERSVLCRLGWSGLCVWGQANFRPGGWLLNAQAEPDVLL